MIADLYNIPTVNDKKLVPNYFEKEKYLLHVNAQKRIGAEKNGDKDGKAFY